MGPAQIAERVAKVRALAAQGLTRMEIAGKAGMSYDAVKGIIRQHSIAVVSSATGPKPIRASSRAKQKMPAGTMRLCLCGCGKQFPSLHIGERIAPKCRSAWEAR